MRQSERVRGGAEEVGEQSRRGSWPDTASTSHSSLGTPDEAPPGRKVQKFNRALAPEADSFKFSRRPWRRTGLSLSPADLVEEFAQQECGPK